MSAGNGHGAKTVAAGQGLRTITVTGDEAQVGTITVTGDEHDTGYILASFDVRVISGQSPPACRILQVTMPRLGDDDGGSYAVPMVKGIAETIAHRFLMSGPDRNVAVQIRAVPSDVNPVPRVFMASYSCLEYKMTVSEIPAALWRDA